MADNLLPFPVHHCSDPGLHRMALASIGFQ
jgi:hypothetical protein